MFKIKKIDKITVSYFITFFLSSTLLFITIFLLFSFLQIISDRDISKGISMILLFKSVVYLIPSVITNSIIFSAVFSSFFTVGEMSSRGELIALRCSGYSYENIIRKIILITIIISPFLSYFNHNIVPLTRLKSRQAFKTMMNRITNINFKSGAFEKISSTRIIASETSNSTFQEITMIKKNLKELNESQKNFILQINALNGTHTTIKDKGILISLNRGNIYFLDRDKTDIFYRGTFSNYQTFIPFEIKENNFNINPKFMTTSQIKQMIKSLNETQSINLRKEIYWRSSSSISVIAITFLSLVIALIYERESKYFSFVATLAIVILYYGFDITTDYLISKQATAYPELKFAAVLVIFSAAIYLYFFKLRKK